MDRNIFCSKLKLTRPVQYRFDVSNPVIAYEDLVINGDVHRKESPNTKDADATFRCNTGNYILLVFGRLQVERGLADGRLSIEGSIERARNFNAWFKGF